MNNPQAERELLDKLEMLARAATPGQWMRLFGERTVYDRMEDGCRGNAIVRADLAYSTTDAANLDFIAAANPATLLKLIEMARRTAATPAQGDELPPLPEPDHSLDCGSQPFFTDAQMREYGAACRAGAKQGDEDARDA